MKIFSWNVNGICAVHNKKLFVPFIEKELNAKVANLARSGGDFSGAMNAYLSSVAFKKTPPKLVIWEIPERVLQQKASTDSIQ